MTSNTISSSLRLPTLVFGSAEVRRLQIELANLEEYLQQAAIRDKATKLVSSLPKVSRMLDALAAENHYNLLKAQERAALRDFLNALQSAPSVHMSFASDPSAAFTAKLVAWLRTNIHPWTLLQIGLQPSLAAGCTVRTPNKVFDLSLRQHFDEQKGQLVAALRPQPVPSAPVPAAATAEATSAQSPSSPQGVEA